MYICLILVTSLVTIIISFVLHKFQYWQRKGVKTLRHNAFVVSRLQLEHMNHSTILRGMYRKLYIHQTRVSNFGSGFGEEYPNKRF